MKTIACYKVSPDNQDISVLPDHSISFDRAQNVLGEYDLVAIEEAVRLAEQTGGACTLLSVGDSKLEDSKLVKGALSRGAEDLICRPVPDRLRHRKRVERSRVRPGRLRRRLL